MFNFLKKIKLYIQGSWLDVCIRYTFNFFSIFYYKLIKVDLGFKPSSILIISYGGMGDIVLLFPCILKLSNFFNVCLFIEKKFLHLQNLLPTNVKVIGYEKQNLFKDLINFEKKNRKCFFLFQHSPIFEFVIFNFLLRRPPVVGTLFSQNRMDLAGFRNKNKYDLPINKVKKYDKIYELIMDQNIYPKIANIKNFKKRVNKKIAKYNFKNYFVLSPSKTPNWNVGLIDPIVYANFLIKINNLSLLTPVIVGTKEDLRFINQIINILPKNFKIINTVGKTSINDLLKIVKNSTFVISNDNGVHHLSNFLKKPTITIFTFSSPQVFGWEELNSHSIFNNKFECMPCVGLHDKPMDNYPFVCPWGNRCTTTINEEHLLSKLQLLNLV